MSSKKYTVGIDIGGTNFRIGLVDEKGELSRYEKHSVDILADDPVNRLCDMVSKYINSWADGEVSAVCAGFPATIDKERKHVLNAPNVKGFDGVAVADIFSEKLSLPCFIEKDVNLLLLSDLQKLNIKSRDIIACYIGTGIGNAIMIDGNLLLGHNGVAGELGHIPYGDSDILCGCGNKGCAEPLAGGRFLADIANGDISNLFADYQKNDALCKYIERLGRVISAEINIIDPEVVLLGGGVINMKAFPKEDLEKSILTHTRKPLPHDNIKIMYSDNLDGTGGVVGAGIYAWRKIK